MKKEYRIIVVHNSTRRVPDAEVTYTVRLADVEACKSIRLKFGSFFVGAPGKGRVPAELKGISIQNRITPNTKTRIAIMKLIAQRYRDSNPGSKVKVIGYEPRPLFKLSPAASATDRRVQTYNFIETVKKFPTNFSPEEVEPILKRINPELVGKIRSLFIVLSDDQFKKRLQKVQAPPVTVGANADAEENPSDEEDAMEGEETSSDSSNMVTGISQPTPPVVAASASSGPKASRSNKRGASSALGSNAKK